MASISKFKEGMLDRRQRRYILRQIARNMWPFKRHDLWRFYNAARLNMSRGEANIKAQPFFAEVEVTTACNLRCRFCLNPTLPSPRHRITYEQFVHILDSMPGLIAMSLLGLGEPTLNKDLFRMAAEARRRKIYVFTVTNLNIPEKSIRQLAESDFNEINISLESTDPERYAWFRTGGDLAKMEDNLRLLGELREQNGKDFSIGLWTTLTEETIPEVEQVFEWCVDKKIVERVQFQFVSDKPMHLDIYEEDMKGQLIQDWQASDRRLTEIIWGHSNRYGIMGTLVQSRCGWPWSGFFINAEGLLSPCCFIKDYRNPVWGDISVDSLDTIWLSDEWVGVRDGLINRKPHAACQGCPYAYI